MKITPQKLTLTALFMGMTILLSTFSIPILTAHFYFCDTAIYTAAILLADPVLAFIVGGVGTFLADMMFYPQSMFVSLFAHGLQAVAAALCVRYLLPKKPAVSALIGMIIGSIIMIIGFTFGRAFVYSTIESALLKLPGESLQAAFGTATAYLLCFGLSPQHRHGLLKLYHSKFASDQA